MRPSEILVETLPVEGLKTLRVEEKQGEIVEIEEGSSVLDECYGRTLNPFSVENTGVDIGLAFEGVAAEFRRVDGWHHKKTRGGRGFLLSRTLGCTSGAHWCTSQHHRHSVRMHGSALERIY